MSEVLAKTCADCSVQMLHYRSLHFNIFAWQVLDFIVIQKLVKCPSKFIATVSKYSEWFSLASPQDMFEGSHSIWWLFGFDGNSPTPL